MHHHFDMRILPLFIVAASVLFTADAAIIGINPEGSFVAFQITSTGGPGEEFTKTETVSDWDGSGVTFDLGPSEIYPPGGSFMTFRTDFGEGFQMVSNTWYLLNTFEGGSLSITYSYNINFVVGPEGFAASDLPTVGQFFAEVIPGETLTHTLDISWTSSELGIVNEFNYDFSWTNPWPGIYPWGSGFGDSAGDLPALPSGSILSQAGSGTFSFTGGYVAGGYFAPEPSSFLLTALGPFAWAFRRRRR